MLLNVGKEVKVCKEDEECDGICTHRLHIEELKEQQDKREDDTHQRDNLRVSTVKDEGQECVEEDADKLDHLQSGQVPGSKKKVSGQLFAFFVDATLFNS